MTKRPDLPPVVVDSEDLTNTDWAEINKLKRAFENGGSKAFWEAMDRLGEDDLGTQVHIAGAFWPEMVKDLIKDAIADAGMTEEDIREVMRKLKSSQSGGSQTRH
jgi:hypothetical protein